MEGVGSSSSQGRPLVSAVIPTYNSCAYLRRAIDSVLSQTYHELECIVVDDGSTDDTAAILASYGSRIIRISQENRGAAAARNRGMEVARGRYIAFLDSDDYWLETKIASQVSVFLTNPDLVLVSTDLDWIQGSESPEISAPSKPFDVHRIEVFRDLLGLLADPYLGTPTVMVDANSIKEVGGFNSDLRVAEDIDMYFRICRLGPYAKIHQVLCRVQARPDSLTQQVCGYPNLLQIFEQLEDEMPQLALQEPELFERSRWQILSWWIRDLLVLGDGVGARRVIRQARSVTDSDKLRALHLKSYIVPWTARIRRLLNR